MPAVLAILEHASSELCTEVFLEVPIDADVRADIVCPENTTAHWLPRTIRP